MQELAHTFGGEVSPSTEREFGRAYIHKTQENHEAAELLLQGIDDVTGVQMWMSHGDKVTRMPEGFVKVAHTENSEHAGIDIVNLLNMAIISLSIENKLSPIPRKECSVFSFTLRYFCCATLAVMKVLTIFIY
jgi:hypothetical protein